MTLTKTIAAVALSASMVAGPLVTAASARDWDRGGPGSGRGASSYQDRGFQDRGRGDWARGRGDWDRDRYDAPRRHNNHARNIALGAFAAILGLAIASEATRSHGYDRY